MTTTSLTNEYQAPLEAALRAAKEAGQILASRRHDAREIHRKGFRDIVTDSDFAANAAIRSILEKAFPSHAILSEEDPRPQVSVRSAENIWVVDPLDGTTNYSRNYPVYAVSIALAQRGHIKVGVIYDPLRDECFWASEGGGAFADGRRLQVSEVTKFEDSVLGYELSKEQGLRERGLRWFAELASRAGTARIGGSAALSMSYIAAARLDGYLHLSLYPWDIAAGIIIAREAGARVTHFDGRAATLSGGDYVAGNRQYVALLLKSIAELQERDRQDGK